MTTEQVIIAAAVQALDSGDRDAYDKLVRIARDPQAVKDLVAKAEQQAKGQGTK